MSNVDSSLKSDYEVDLGMAAQEWSLFEHIPHRVEDLFSTSIPTPDGRYVKVPTHYEPGREITLIAYDDAWGPSQQDIARFLEPGEVFIAVKHHKPEHPTLESAGKEAVKFDASHVSVGVGVEVPEGSIGKHRGAVTINNPQDYGGHQGADDGRGLFGTRDYPMIFLRLKFRPKVMAEQQAMYMDNIRTWLVIANTFTNFPQKDYDGNDPLGTLSVKAIRVLGDKLLDALVGEFEQKRAARKWLDQPANQVYCSELAHVAVNLGIHYPLNRAFLGDRYPSVREALETKTFVERNKNPRACLVDLTLAPDDLVPIMELLGETSTEPGPWRPFGYGLALRPMTMTDLVREYLQLVEREKWGEMAAAPLQARLFRMIRPGLIEQMGLTALPQEDSRRRAAREAVEQLLDAIEEHLKTPAPSYEKFKEGLQPLLREAGQMSGPRPDGSGAFLPPHGWLLHALGRLPPQEDSLMGLEVIGHGLHASMLKRGTE